VIATNNSGKLREFDVLLADIPARFIAARDAGVTTFPPETGSTFAANARAKASFVTAETGYPAIADDSGLAVDALDGIPGVYSARYGGSGLSDADRWCLLLENLRSVSPEDRSARFIAAIAFSLPDGTVHEAEGRLEGSIAASARGEYGFGYDPVFLVGDTGRTLAEMADEEKNSLSHRARAVAALRPALVAALAALGG
jgi:XTP/dITP diphosphohydrolase